jgi:hypothetical protein
METKQIGKVLRWRIPAMRKNNSLGLSSILMDRFGHAKSAKAMDLFYLYSFCFLREERLKRAQIAGRCV